MVTTLDQLRLALERYRQDAGRRDRGRPIATKQLASEIERHCGFSVDDHRGEMLRQFLVGYKIKDENAPGGRRLVYRVPEDHKREAIEGFLREKGYLPQQDNAQPDDPLFAAYALAEYTHPKDTTLLPWLFGNYVAVTAADGHVYETVLDIDQTALANVMAVRQALTKYRDPAHRPFPQWDERDFKYNLVYKAHRSGWAVMDGLKRVFMIVRDADRIIAQTWYIVQASDSATRPPEALALLHYREKLEVGSWEDMLNGETAEMMASTAAGSLRYFFNRRERSLKFAFGAQ